MFGVKELAMKSLMRVFVIGFVFTCFLTVGFAAKLTPAEEMTRCLPDGTVGFVAGSGMDSVGPAFKKTALGQVLANDQLGAIFNTLCVKGMELAEKEGDEEDIKTAKLFIELARLVCRRPFIAGISENPNGGEVPISGFLIVDSGPIRKDINKILKQLEKLDSEGDIFKKLVGPCRMKVVKICDGQYAYWGFAGKKFVIAVCDKEGLILKNIFWPSKEIPKNLSKIPQAGDALVINYDYQAILSLVGKCVKMADPKGQHLQEFDKIMKVYEELGITSIGNYTARVGFSGADILVDQAVELPSPRKGVYNCYKNVDMAIFDLVEPEAMKAGAMNFDFPKACNLTIDAYKKVISKKLLKMIIKQTAAFEKMANINIREGILDSIAGEGVFYIIPAGAMMQSPSGGVVAIARLTDDGAKFEQSMKALGQFAAGMSKGMLQISTIPKGDVTIHTWTVMPLAMMQIMPCWAIVDGNVVIASNAVLCGKAIDRIKSEDASKDSLRSTVAFKAAVKGLPDELVSLVYTDSKVQFKQLTMQAQRVWPMVSMAVMQQGIKLPAMLPNFDEAIKDLKPAASYSWTDKDGVYSHYQGSGIEVGTVAVVGVIAAVLMPALAKAKKQAKKIVSTSNLHQISVACMLYANDTNGNLPPSLDGPELQKYLGDSGKRVLVSSRKPKTFSGPSYIYVKGQNIKMNSQNIIAYENTKYLHDSTVAVFLDGHVEQLKANAFVKKLKATYKRLGKEAPIVRFLSDIPMEIKQVPAEDIKFQQQMKESKKKVKKQLDEQQKKKNQPKKKVKPKKVKPKKTGHKAVAAAIAS